MGDQRGAARRALRLVDCAFDAAGRAADELATRAGPHLHPQALDHPSVHYVLFDDLVDVRLVDVGVPDRVGIDDHAGAFLAAVEAARLVHAHLARARQAERLDAALGILAHARRALVVAAGAAAVALVAAEENVSLVVRHEGRILRAQRPARGEEG